MTLFVFKDTKEQEKKAACLQFGININDVVNLDDLFNTKHLDAKDPIVILGHSQPVTEHNLFNTVQYDAVGEKSAQDLANLLNQKSSIKGGADIYLIACEAGYNDTDNKPCYARAFAYALHQKGITNTKVHAFTSPKNINPKEHMGMRVEMMLSTSKSKKQGDVGVYLWTKGLEDFKNTATTLEKVNFNIEKTANQIIPAQSKAQDILNYPEHTFVGQSDIKKIKSQPWTFDFRALTIARKIVHKINETASVMKKKDRDYGKIQHFLLKLDGLHQSILKKPEDVGSVIRSEINAYHKPLSLKKPKKSLYYVHPAA